MKIGLVLAPLLLATTVASAQAPGDYEEGEVAAPGMAPTIPEPAPAPMPERPRRWSVGLGLGSLSVAPHSAPDAPTDFSVGQLAVRYLATRHLELEVALSGGGEAMHEGYQGDNVVQSAVLAVRYRFQPQRRWNGWVMAGMGTFSIASQSASDQERADAEQSTMQFGLGLERRFHRFAVQLEGRAVGVKPNDAGMTTVDVKPEAGPNQPLPPDQINPTPSRDGWAGGQMTISGNYYF